MNKQQIKDNEKCEEMSMSGKDMECLGCSCSVCIAQEPTDFKSGLKKAVKIIKKELEFAKQVNPQMALGMSQILMLIEEEIGK